MKKYFVIILLTTLFLVSCNKKLDDKNMETSTSKIDVSTQKIEETKETSTSKIEDVKEEIKKDGLVIYKNKTKGFELSYSSNLKKEESNGIFIVMDSSNESVNIVTEDFSKANIKDFKDYIDLSIKNIKSVLNVSDVKKEDIVINDEKGFKLSYIMEVKGKKFFIEQFAFSNDKKLSFIITKTLLSQNENEKLKSIVNSFKLIK